MLLSSRSIAAWCRSAPLLRAPRDVFAETRSQAKAIWDALQDGQPAAGFDVAADVAYAMREVLLSDRSAIANWAEPASEAFRLLSSATWPDTAFSEKEEILADVAYAISVWCRLHSDDKATRHWENECVTQLQHVEPARSYLDAFVSVSSESLDARFLSRPPVLLAMCRLLEARRNHNPSEILELATRVFVVLRNLDDGLEEDDRAYFGGDLAVTAAVAAGHLVRLDEMVGWLQAATDCYERTSVGEAYAWRIETYRAVLLNYMHRYTESLQVLNVVIPNLERLELEECAFSARLTKGMQLKNLGRYAECMTCLDETLVRYPAMDDLRRGFALAHLADARLELGEFSQAARDIQQALPLFERADSLLGMSCIQTVVGQFLRAGGRPREAVAVLKATAETHAAAKSAFFEGYTRILLAETLITMGSNRDATRELLAAIPLIEDAGVDQQMLAALRLLQIAARESRAELSDVSQFRERLTKRAGFNSRI